jgi:hypothetical protein
MSNIREYWPEFLTQVREFGLIADAEDPEMSGLQDELSAVLNDQFIVTATTRGIARREIMLGVVPYGDDDLETRRFRIAGKWLSRLPYTMRMFEARLDALLGVGKYVVELHKEPYTLRVLLEIVAKRQFEAAKEMLRDIAPANLVLVVELRYNQHSTIGQFTHQQLAEYTHLDIREEVIV